MNRSRYGPAAEMRETCSAPAKADAEGWTPVSSDQHHTACATTAHADSVSTARSGGGPGGPTGVGAGTAVCDVVRAPVTMGAATRASPSALQPTNQESTGTCNGRSDCDLHVEAI
jgi:hypothetical protein